MPDRTTAELFTFFNEVAIIGQLSSAMFEARLPSGLQVSHFSVVNHLVRVRDGSTPLELARAFQVAKTTMTHTLGGLVKAGHVEMRPNPDDGRSKRVWLTPTGRAFRLEAIESLAPDLEEIATALDAGRIAALVPELQRIREWMDDRRSE